MEDKCACPLAATLAGFATGHEERSFQRLGVKKAFCFGNLTYVIWIPIRWYSKIAQIPPGFVELPLRMAEEDGSLKETNHSIAIAWPWDLLSWLHRKNHLLQWASNTPQADIVIAENRRYWRALGNEESVQNLNLQNPEMTFPIFWHTDGVRVYKQQKCWIYSYSCANKKGPSLSSKLMMLLVREPLIWKPFTHDRIGELVGWIQRVLQTGRFPATDFNGDPWPAGSAEAGRANNLIAGGYMFAFSGFKGDWEARVVVHKLQRSYNHNNICEHCPASKLDTAFNYRNFALDAAYLDVCFTHAQFMIMTPEHLRSSWQSVPGWTKDRNLEETCASVSCCVFPTGLINEEILCLHFGIKWFVVSGFTVPRLIVQSGEYFFGGLTQDLLHVLHQGVACCVIPALVCAHFESKFGDALTLKQYDRLLQTEVWQHYKAWCRKTKVPGCGHRFTLGRFGRESWGTQPELQSCYKAYTVKMMIYWLHAFLFDVQAEATGGPERVCTSYALAKMQFDFDMSGPFLTDSMRRDAVTMGRSFLLFYHQLCSENLGQERRNFKMIPKFHSFLHLLLYVERTSRNPRPEIPKLRFMS